MAAMRRGDFTAAWTISDAVLAAHDPAKRDDPRLPYHRRWVWDGRPYAGRDVLVRCYHGLGDSIQFVRFLALLRPRVRSLALEVQPELMELLHGLAGADRLIPFRPEAPHPPAECDLEVMELAHALRVIPDALAAGTPYLPLAAERMREESGARNGIAVGICWQAGEWDSERSLPIELLAPAVALPGVRLVSLQRSGTAAAALAADAAVLASPAERSTAVLETAALIASLDLVVTVDTMVAHLAGALGRPTWLLLKADADWRWMEARADSPWYPTMRLYRQRRPGDWRDPLAALGADLSRAVAGRLDPRLARTSTSCGG